MRPLIFSLLTALAAFAVFTVLPASLGIVSLLRALVFIAGFACLVGALFSTWRPLAASLPARTH
ncbi:MAG: hypothetical protein ACRC50_04095 [Gaiella sp.]